MKLIYVAALMAVTGIVQASDSEQCGSAVDATASFMTTTYGVNSRDVRIQVVSAKKDPKGQLVADVLSSAGAHKCALKLSPALPKRGTLYVCQWSLQVASCDSPETLKREIIDEPSWVADKATVNAWQEGMRKGLEESVKGTNKASE